MMKSKPKAAQPGKKVLNVSMQDTRITRSKASVLKVTWELLSENGMGGVSVDEVARRSGVAKTTIYRHWPTRSDLLIEACSQVEAKQEVPAKGSLKANLEELMRDLAKMLKTAKWASVLPSVVDAAERDPAIAQLHGRLQRSHAAGFQEVIQRAINAREIPKSTDSALMIASLVGPLYYRRWFSREPLDGKFIKNLVGKVLGL